MEHEVIRIRRADREDPAGHVFHRWSTSKAPRTRARSMQHEWSPHEWGQFVSAADFLSEPHHEVLLNCLFTISGGAVDPLGGFAGTDPTVRAIGSATLVSRGELTARREAHRALQLYKKEITRLRSEQRLAELDKERDRRREFAYLDESIALAHPIAFRLLGWLYFRGPIALGNVFEKFGDSASTLEGVARLHFLGAVRYDESKLEITKFGARILHAFGFVDDQAAGGGSTTEVTSSDDR